MSLPFRAVKEKLERLPSILPASALIELGHLKAGPQLLVGELEPIEQHDPLKGIPVKQDRNVMRGRSTISIDGGSNFWTLPFGTLLLGRVGAARRFFLGNDSPPIEYLALLREISAFLPLLL